MHELKNQMCPVCRKKTLTLIEDEREVPFFGKLRIFSMTCVSCKYHKADVESEESKEPSKYSIEISSSDDMKIRVVKSSEATIKIPHVATVSPGVASQGFVTNIEGVLNRIKRNIESARDAEENPDAKKKAKRMLKKLQKVMWGREKMKLIIEDPSGNSAIISEKAVKSKLKG
ncbi:ZPR1 zinc finger domain-containing protein [Candidatus Woesearchaeota archaeon]|nr:ZPR1 zinc finger domain-containing protein [Candidatus Woesearchaeota archaeon]